MKLEVLLSCMNFNKNDLKKMNITSPCLVINQCKKESIWHNKKLRIYSYDEIGLARSRNRALENATADILLLSDDDVVYDKNYESMILSEFMKNPEADVIVFNLFSPNRAQKENKKEKRIRIYNALRYSSPRIAFRKESITKKNIKFNELFGANAKYSCGEDTLFLVECLRKKLKIYASTRNIGTVYHQKSTWFSSYDDKFFIDKGAVFYEISSTLAIPLCLQYLLRHHEVLEEMSFPHALKLMIKGCKQYREEEVSHEK